MAASDIVSNARAGHSAKATRYNIFVVLFLALGSFTYGYDNAALTNVLGQQAFFEYFSLATSGPGESHTNAIEGTLNGLFSAGGFTGALAMSWMADRLGRKLSIQIASVICVIGAAIQGGSINVGMLLASRFITGIGVGMEVVIVPLFQSEVSH
jgi:MFS family permease